MGKGIYGDSLEHHIESANFTVQWNGNDTTEEYAQSVIDQLEAAWSLLIEEKGWPQPVSSDEYLLWVILDPTVSGYTTLYTSDEYPQGYPVSYVSPGYADADYPGYSLSVAVHEMTHMIQFGVRDYWSESGPGTWYWEASAEWMADQGAPDINTYGESTYWYSINTTLKYNSIESYHQYGMLLLPRYIEDTWGAEVVQMSWVDNGGNDWVDVIEQVTGQDIEALIPEMAGAYAAGALSESELFYDPEYAESTGSSDHGGWLGTTYVQVALEEDEEFVVSGPATVRYAVDGEWTEIPQSQVFIAAITRLENGAITWGIQTVEIEPEVNDDSDADTAIEPAQKNCGCTSPIAPSVIPLVLGMCFLRRRQSKS